MNLKFKQTALTVAGIASVLAAGQTVANAASTYTVKSGDTLSEVADKFNLTVDDLVNANNLKNADMIFKDQKITVPDSKKAKTNASAVKAAAASAASAAAASLAAASDAASEAYASSVAESEAYASSVAASEAAAQASANASTATTTTVSGSGSVYDRFIAAGGTDAMWTIIVMPESGGNPNAVSPAGYRGLGQTMEAWGTGTVEEQARGMVNYMVSRYGSIDAAIQFRLANGWY
jgi:murein DD-endopeptidase MepM/ murein hydrolase activator NlpD